MTTTQHTEIPGYGDRFGDVHPGAWIMDPEARLCLNCDTFIQVVNLATHRDECPLWGPNENDQDDCGIVLVPSSVIDRIDQPVVLEGRIVDVACAFCGTTDDLSFEEDPFAGDVYNDHAPLWICGPCISDRKDEV
jgi:hypothetical protein